LHFPLKCIHSLKTERKPKTRNERKRDAGRDKIMEKENKRKLQKRQKNAEMGSFGRTRHTDFNDDREDVRTESK